MATKYKIGDIISLAAICLMGIVGNILMFYSQFGTSDKNAAWLSIIFAIFFVVVGLLIIIIRMIKIAKSDRDIDDIAPWWLWVVAIVLNVLPFIEWIIFSAA